jgi:HK97 family phage major capsid protein
MESIQALRERKATLRASAQDVLNKHPAAKWDASAQAAYDAVVNELDAVDAHIKRVEKIMDTDAETKLGDQAADATQRVARDRFGIKDVSKLPATHPLNIFLTFARKGERGLSAEQLVEIRNTMSTTTNSEGGFTVPSLISSQLINIMKAYGTMRLLAEVIQTSDGKPLSFPTTDGTAEVGEIIAQNTTATGLDPSFGSVSLNVFKYSSKIVAVPIELLQDTVVDIEGMILSRLGQRLGRIANQHFTTGGGTTVPDGVIPRAAVGKTGTTGQTLTIIYDDLVDLVHSVDPAYRSNKAAFQTNDTLLRVLRKIKDTSGRPIWSPSYEGGMRVGVNVGAGTDGGHGGFTGEAAPAVFDYLLGYPVFVNNDIAVPAANAKTMSFGDHSLYKIRDAMDMRLFRFEDSNYARLGQVGFLAWARMGGNLVDTNAVKVYQHSAT